MSLSFTSPKTTNYHNSTASAGIWHYIKVFCTFFSLIATFAAVTTMIRMRSDYIGLLALMWVIGVLGAVIVAPGKFLKFGWGIMYACGTFGFFLLPIPFCFLSFFFSVAAGLVAAFLSLMVVPAIFTIYTYVTDIRYDATDNKKEWIAIIAGVGTALVCFALFIGLTAVGQAVEAPKMEEKFDVVKIYEEYTSEHEDAKEYSSEILANPITTEKMDDGYIRKNYYEFTQQEGDLQVQYNVTMAFEYINKKWTVTGVEETSAPIGFNAISGTWTGTGEYPENLSAGNQYVLSFNASKENGGTGTLDVTHEGWNGRHFEFTVQVVGFSDGYTEFLNSDLGTVLSLKFVLKEPLVYEVFGIQKVVSEIECVYCFDANVVMLKTFDRGLVLSPNK